jgi:4-methyl-5(b-hydroxyethyl)-thiazole monophosphate biosynthesis
MTTVLVPLAEGVEEMEAVTIIDILRRAGIEVLAAGLADGPVTASRNVRLMPDMSLDEALQRDLDMVVLPGGGLGTDNLNKDARIHDVLKRLAESGKFVGAICAAPVVLANAGLLKGKQATSYPGFLDTMGLPDVTYKSDKVVKDGKVITSRGPGTAVDFALAVVETLVGKDKRDEVEKGLVRN